MKCKFTNTDLPSIPEAVQHIAKKLDDSDARVILYFASSHFEPAVLAKAMAAAFPKVATIGCTTAGEISTGRMSERSISAMSLGGELVKRCEARLLLGVGADARGRVAAAFADLSQAIGTPISDLDPGRYVGLILADGLAGAEEKLMEAIGDRTNLSFVGGSAGDDLKFQRTQVFLGVEAASDAAILVILESAVPFQIVKTQSFQALPQRLVATKVDTAKRKVMEFNGEPAAVAYAKALGVPTADLAGKFMSNPLGLLAGETIFVRSPQRIEGDSVYFYCQILEGMEMALLASTDIVVDTREALATVPDAAAIIDFHCILRTLELRQKGQCGAYGSVFGKVPAIGFSTYGEEYIGHINQTSTMLVFRTA
jgi:hypothetical protein